MAALALAITALLVAGCGDDDEGGVTEDSAASAAVEVDGQPANYKGAETVTGEAVEMEEDEYYFEPTVLSGEPGQKVTVEITNEGDEEHNFTVEDQGIDEDTGPGESTTVKAEIPDSGMVPFYCSYHETENMRGALAVTGEEPPASESASPDSGGGYGGY